MANYVITLLHGTWAPHAKWASDKASSFRFALTSFLGEDIVLIESPWTGLNRRSARKNAASLLRGHILKIAQEYPTHLHFIIAHSHGGNVVLYALRDPQVSSKVVGVACMATPFLVAKERDLGPFFVANLEVVVGGLGAGLVWIICGFLVTFFPFLSHLPAMILFSSILFPLAFLAEKLHTWWKQLYQTTLFDLTLATPDYKMLMVREPGDEASSGLAVAQFGSWLTATLALFISGIIHWLEAISDRLRASIVIRWAVRLQEWQWKKHPASVFFMPGPLPLQILVLSAILPIMGMASADDLWHGGGLLSVCAIALIVIFGLFVYNIPVYAIKFLVGLASLPFLLFGCLFMLPFGYDVMLSSVFLEINVEATPPGSWPVFQSPTSSSKFRHSFTYEDPAVQEEISTWIEKTAYERTQT